MALSKLDSGNGPISMLAAKNKLEKEKEIENAASNAAAALVEDLQKDAQKDEFDHAQEREEQEELLQQAAAAALKRRKAPCGMEAGSLAEVPAASKAKAKSGPKKKLSEKHASALPSLLEEMQAAAGTAGGSGADAASKAPSSLSGKKSAVPAAALDTDMALVASVHSGQSSKCLENLTPAAFFDPECKRTTLSAKLRGASCLIYGFCSEPTEHCVIVTFRSVTMTCKFTSLVLLLLRTLSTASSPPSVDSTLTLLTLL